MNIRNIHTDTLEIAHADCSEVVEAGGTADVPDHVGESLIQQVDRWEQVQTSKAEKATSKEKS